MTLPGMKETGRRLSSPFGQLVQLESDRGLKHTALVFDPVLRGAECLNAELQASIPFMESPGVSGIVPLVQYDRAAGSFVYSSGTVWSIAEVVRAFADLGETCGHRAGLELAYVTSQILIAASEKGSPVGVWSHGSLSPYNLALRSDGQVRVLGYGLPQVELVEYLASEASPIKEDSFRYAPPERIEGREEDITSDLFALTLIAVELMVGKPVYDGLLADVRQQAARAEGTYRLYRWRDLLPSTIRDALAPAMKYDDDARYRDPAEYVYAMHDLLGSPDIEGPSLMEIVQRVKMAELKGKPIVAGRTAALTREELAAMAAELDDDDDAPLPPPSMPRPNAPEPEPEPDEDQPRWASVRRAGRRSRGSEEEEPAAPKPPPTRPSRRSSASDAGPDRAASLRERLRRSRSEGPPSSQSGTDAEDDPRAALRRRLREGSRASSSPAPNPPAPPAPVVEEPPEPVPSAPPAPEPAPSLSTSSGSAAELLARLRSSSGRRRGARRDVPRTNPLADESLVDEVRDKPAPDQLVLTLDLGERTAEIALPPNTTLADAAARVAAEHAPARVDLAGRLLSAPRLEQDGRWWSGREAVSLLDAGRPVQVVQVPNDTVVLELRIDGTPGQRFQAPVGVALTARQIVDQLTSWLGLAPGSWRLVVGDTELLPAQLLADVEPTRGQLVVVRR